MDSLDSRKAKEIMASWKRKKTKKTTQKLFCKQGKTVDQQPDVLARLLGCTNDQRKGGLHKQYQAGFTQALTHVEEEVELEHGAKGNEQQGEQHRRQDLHCQPGQPEGCGQEQRGNMGEGCEDGSRNRGGRGRHAGV